MIDASIVLAWMLRLQPQAPWRESFEHTADVIVESATKDPIDNNPIWTAALLTSIGWFESRFEPRARNVSSGTLGIWQVSPHWAPRSVLEIPDTEAPIAITLIRESFRVCKRAPESARLSWYTGRPTPQEPCPSGGNETSKWRLALAKRLAKDVPE
jgi:hypothetical protein